MCTFFTTAKPFHAHSGIIQSNALSSWTRTHPDVEVILFGDEQGVADVARRLGLRHEPHVERTAAGNKRLDYLFAKAREIARHDTLCYVNCDIILLDDFIPALELVRDEHPRFLVVGRRWDADVTQPIDFSQHEWQSKLRQQVRARGRQRPGHWIDYFAFSRRVYQTPIPPFAIGRIYWDNWLLCRAQREGAMVVDASRAVLAIHQNHDYGYHPQGMAGVWNDAQSRRNLRLAQGFRHLRAIGSAQRRLTERGLVINRFSGLNHWIWFLRRLAERQVSPALQNLIWHPILNLTRPIRRRIGLRQANLSSRFLHGNSPE